MDWNIEGGYGFKISCKIGDDEPVKANSLEEALTRLSSDKILWALYNLRIKDRMYDINKIALSYEDVAQLNEQQIYELIQQEVKIKHNLQ